MRTGQLLPRPDADGGVSVRFALPDPTAGDDGDPGAAVASSVLEGFPGCAVTIEDMFDVAQDFITARPQRCVVLTWLTWF